MNGVCHGSGKNALRVQSEARAFYNGVQYSRFGPSFIKLTKAATTNLTYLDETNTITTIRHTIPIPAKA
ncbi:MAG TPA: hypothetical protein ENG03_00665 [Thioploca sp.]|nr:MAG: hypothetical protein B6247_00955 [Beggiatoa sp. 4572_84]RKZ62237.1 MAG: hypothetical protein DRR08_06525 [Gammaproteobacteria bacterium]HDN25614.1 hypothetical protein [Thioploca sp.]